MDVDKIIDSSSSEQEAFERIMEKARTDHGDEFVDKVIDTSSDEESAKASIVSLARASVPNTEDKYLGDVYEGFKKLGYLAKPFSTLGTPITEGLRAPLKYIAENVGEDTSDTPPIDSMAEFKQWEPSDRAGSSLLLNELNNAFGIKNQPLLNVESESFPKAAAVLNHVSTPANVAGIVADVSLGLGKIPGIRGTQIKVPGTPLDIYPGDMVPGVVGKTLGAGYDLAGKAVPQSVKTAFSKEQMVKNYLRSISKNKPLYQDLADSGKIQEIESLMGNHPDKYIQPFNQEGVLDVLDGPIEQVVNAETGLPSPRRNMARGEIGKLGVQQDMIVDQIPNDAVIEQGRGRTSGSGYDVSRMEMASNAKDKLRAKGLDANQVSAAEKIIDDVMNVIQFDDEKIKLIGDVNDADSRANAISQQIADETERIVLGNGEKIRSEVSRLDGIPENLENPKYRPGQRNEPQTITNEVYSTIESDITQKISALNEEIKELQSGQLTDPKKYNKLSKLMKNKKALEDFYYNNLDDSALTVDQYKTMIQERNMEPIGFANTIRKRGNVYKTSFNPNESPLDIAAREQAGNVLESVGSDALQQGLGQLSNDDVALYNQTNKDISNRIDLQNLITKQRTSPSAGPNVPVGGLVRGAARESISLKDEYGMPMAHKAMNAMKRAGVTYGTQGAKMAGVNLQSYLIPRSSEQILAEQDLIADKLLKELGPKGVVMFQEAIKNPKMLPTILQQMEMARPEMFQADEYGRFDGMIFDPMMKQKAIENIIHNQPSSIEGAKQMQLLLNGNKYYGG